MTGIRSYARSAISEISDLVDLLDDGQLAAMVDGIVAAPRIFSTGIGRSGLAARAIAMRLMHIGKVSFVVGEVATPAIDDGDLLLAFTSSGRGSVLEQARCALANGATVAVFTTGENELTGLSNATLLVPARTIVPSRQHAGSLFEQACLVIGDAICRGVQETLGAATSELNARHANLQ